MCARPTTRLQPGAQHGGEMRFWKAALMTLAGVSAAVIVGLQIIYHLTGGLAGDFASIAAASQPPTSGPPPPTPTAGDASPHTWWAGDSDGQSCRSGVSPAEAIHTARSDGTEPKTIDHRDDQGRLTSVDVTQIAGELGQTLTTTFYRDRTDCENALPDHQPIQDQYR